MKRYAIFGDTIVNSKSISKITIEPEINKHVELRLVIRISLEKGKNVAARYCLVSIKDIEKKFGTSHETNWVEKGLNYDNAIDTMLNSDYRSILSAIRRALEDECIMDAHEGDIFYFLNMSNAPDKYREQYLSLIRESTDKEFKFIAMEHEYLDKMQEMCYARNEDEQNKLYEEVSKLHIELYKEQPLPLKDMLRNFEWAKRSENFWRSRS